MKTTVDVLNKMDILYAKNKKFLIALKTKRKLTSSERAIIILLESQLINIFVLKSLLNSRKGLKEI